MSCPFALSTPLLGHSAIHLCPSYSWTKKTTGSYTSQISIASSQLHSIPPCLSFKEAACLPATLPVSYGALVTRGELKAGETVLIHGASGGLGLYAVQIAKAVGATVIATASSSTKLTIASKCGADHCINYSDDDDDVESGNGKRWEDEVLRITRGQGVDVVFDSVGLVRRSLRCLKSQGRILVVGFAGREGNLEKVEMNRVLLKQARLIGYVSLLELLLMHSPKFSRSTVVDRVMSDMMPFFTLQARVLTEHTAFWGDSSHESS